MTLSEIQEMTIKDIRAVTGLSQVAFAKKFFIPRRTLENWEQNHRACPEYTKLLLAHAIGLFNYE